MGRALDERMGERPRSEGKARVNWRAKISDHVAFGLLVYTGLNIFVTAHQLARQDNTLLPYLTLVVLVAAIIPACRAIERRWEQRGEAAWHDPALAGAFRRDAALVWLGAIGLPFLVTALLLALIALF